MAVFSLSLPREDMSKEDMTNYLFMLNEELKYMFSNLTPEDNFSDEAKERYVSDGSYYAKLVEDVEKISYLIGDGESETEFSLTPESLELISESINITGSVTFEDLKTPGKCVINAGNIKAGTVSGDLFEGGEITGTTIGAVTIKATEMSSMSIYADEVSGNTITGGYITGDSIEIPVSEGSSLYVLKATTSSAIVGDFTFSDMMMSNGGKDFRIQANGRMWAYKVYCSNNGSTLSDERLKENIKEIDPKTALEFVKGLRPTTFRVIGGEECSVGFIAQEVKELADRMGIDWKVYTEGDYMSISYSSYVAILAAAIRALKEGL